MHFDPYESKTSKRRRITSNMAIVVIVLMMLCGIYFLIFTDNKTPKYKFEQLELNSFTIAELKDGQSEFEQLKVALESSQSTLFDDNFKQSFPNATALLNLDGTVYDADKPFAVVGGGYITLAQCTISNQTDCRDLAVTIIKLQSLESDDSFTLNMSEITDYTVRYNTRDSSVPLTYLSSGKGTSLDIFKINISVENEALKNSSYRLRLNHAFDIERAKAKLYHQIIFDPVNNSYHKPTVQKGEQSTAIFIDPVDTIADKSGVLSAEYQINLTDKTVHLFNDVDFKYSTQNAEQSKITVSFN